MSARCRAVVGLPLLALAACLPEATLETDAQKASYGIGLNMGRSLVEVQEHVDMPALMKGFTDALSEADQAVSDEDIGAAMTAFNEMVQAAAQEEGLAEGEAYLSENGMKEGVMTTESGLQYEVLREGDGDTPVSGQQVTLALPRDADRRDRVRLFVWPRGTRHLRRGQRHRGLRRGRQADAGGRPNPCGHSHRPRLRSAGVGPVRIGPNQVLIFEIELLEILQ